MSGVTSLLPLAECDSSGPAEGYVFKIERNGAGEKISYVRMYSGAVRVRDRLEYGKNKEGKVTATEVFEEGSTQSSSTISAGQIGKLSGLADIQIGDAIGKHMASESGHFDRPTLETVIQPECAAQRGDLYSALAELAEQDPLINLRQDDIRQELYVSLYGEVQKEVIQATLANEYGINVDFQETTTVYIERPVGVGAAVEIIDVEPNPFLATVGLRIEPAPIGTGVEYQLEVELGSMPRAFHRAVEETVRETLREGLYGWEVADCKVTMTHCGYYARQSSAHGGFDKNMSSTAADFRNLTPLVLMNALKQAGTVVFEPIHRFYLEVPEETVTQTSSVLSKARAVLMGQTMKGSIYGLEGEIPVAFVHKLQQQLLGFARGEGVFEHEFDHYKPISGKKPHRSRTDYNPLNRQEYLIRVRRQV
jgi:ribosomal protection tetracycline resistance protein